MKEFDYKINPGVWFCHICRSPLIHMQNFWCDANDICYTNRIYCLSCYEKETKKIHDPRVKFLYFGNMKGAIFKIPDEYRNQPNFTEYEYYRCFFHRHQCDAMVRLGLIKDWVKMVGDSDDADK